MVVIALLCLSTSALEDSIRAYTIIDKKVYLEKKM